MVENRVITFGTFDLFHLGHVRLLGRAAQLGTHLTVGTSTDGFSLRKKGRLPIYNQNERLEIVSSCKPVDECFFEDSLEKKRDYILAYKANTLVMGNDWTGKFDDLEDICKVVYLPRTTGVSTTELLDSIASGNFHASGLKSQM
ncbi:MAG: adenylyltransferase/cytidyltransferase family protein [Hyphomicrobiales bacterium]